MQDFEAIHRIIAIEHQTDESHRSITAALDGNDAHLPLFRAAQPRAGG
jgi:hypothetical protein